MDSQITSVVTSLVGQVTDNALPTIALVLGLIIVPALGIAGLKMAYRKGKGLIR
jgi:hypothetical protein